MRVLRAIDAVNDFAAQVSQWLVLGLVALTTFEVVSRYVFNEPTVWGYELTIMVAASLFALTWGYAERTGSHIRVTAFRSRLPDRWQAILDVIGFFLLTCPLLTVVAWVAVQQTLWSFRVGEVMSLSYWYPPAQPLRVAVLIGVCLVYLQFIASFVRRLHYLIKGDSE